MRILKLHSICALLVLVFGVQAALAEKIIAPKEDRKKTSEQSGGGDTGGGPYVQVNNSRPVAQAEIAGYLAQAEYYLPFAMRYIDYYFHTMQRFEGIYFPQSKMTVFYTYEQFKDSIEKYQLFSSSRDHDSVYEVLKYIRFVPSHKCFNKDGVEEAASVYGEKANEVCISTSKILDPESKIDTGNILASLVGLMAHEVLHKAGITEETGPTWVQMAILARFHPVQKGGQAGYTAWNILRTIEKRKEKLNSMVAKATKNPSAACYNFGFNLVEEVRSIDAEMYHAIEQGISYMSFESYKDWLTSLHILIYASSFCLDNDDMKAMLFPMNTEEDKKAYTEYFWKNVGDQFVPYARREPMTLHSRPIPTTVVGRGDVYNLKIVLDQAQGLLKPVENELRDLLQKIDGGGK